MQGQGGRRRNQRVTALGDSRDRKVVIQTGSCTKAGGGRTGEPPGRWAKHDLSEVGRKEVVTIKKRSRPKSQCHGRWVSRP